MIVLSDFWMGAGIQKFDFDFVWEAYGKTFMLYVDYRLLWC